MRGQNNVAKQPLVRAEGVVSSAQVDRPENFARLTTPSAAIRWLRIFLLMPQPPLLYQEGNVARLQFTHVSKTKFRYGSTAHRKSAGTSVVELYSPMMAGPLIT